MPGTEPWRKVFEAVGFKPHGDYGAMRALVEDVEYVAILHPLDGITIVVTHVSHRTAAQLEQRVPGEVTAQQLASVMANAFEQIHPERRSRSS